MMHHHRNRSRLSRFEFLESRRLLAATVWNETDSINDIAEENRVWVAPETDVIAPRVVSVRVSSQAWHSSYLNRVDPEQGAGFPMAALANQHASLPWSNIDQIHIQFSEDVGVAFDRSLVMVHGIRIADYQSLFNVSYNSDKHVATIQFSEPLSADKLAIALSDELVDADGNQLDGEWLDGGSQLISGDGVAGGSFIYRINVLAGDLSGNGVVLGNDVTAAVLSRGKSVSDADFNLLSDLDGSGETTPEEIDALVRLHGTWLPRTEPLTPSFIFVSTLPLPPVQFGTSIPLHELPSRDGPLIGPFVEKDPLPPIDALTNSASQIQSKQLIEQMELAADEISNDSGELQESELPLNRNASTMIDDPAITKEVGLTTCRPLHRPEQLIVDSVSDILLSAIEPLAYGPLQPEEYRLRFFR